MKKRRKKKQARKVISKPKRRLKSKQQLSTKNIKYRYDEQDGIFVRDSEISVNWFLSEVLDEPNLQITKVSNEQIQEFLYLLEKSDLRMPDGKHSLFWLKEKLDEKFKMAEAKLGEVWSKIADRYHYILEQIDFTLIGSGNIEEKMKIRTEEKKEIYREPSKMEARFEPL